MTSVSPFSVTVFVRAPILGSVKTRIARSLGDPAALAAYLELLNATTRQLATFADVQLAVTPDAALPALEPWLQPGWRLVPQGSGDLGERLTRVVGSHFDQRPCPLLILGSDCPGFTPADIRQAIAALQSSDLVVGPANDGGYWLIGFRAPHAGVFADIEWSSPRVLVQTLAHARRLGLSLQLLRNLSDVDTAEDLARWRAQDQAMGSIPYF